MTTIADDLYSILSTNAGVAALVSTRIYPIVADQGAANPCIVYQQISGVKANQLNGAAVATSYRIQITCWADTPSGARAVAATVITALAGQGYIAFEIDGQDPDTKEYSYQLDWKRWK